jgi:hypothetical protein
MRRALIGSAMALFFSAAVGAQATTQQPPPPTPPQTQQTAPQTPQTTPEKTLVGCVVQGSTANVFILENAVDPADKDAKPQTLKLATTDEEMDFTEHLNHQVQFVGTVTAQTPPPTPPPAGQKVAEKDLQVFTVKTVTPVATTCSAAGQ